jgi:hypothetical protein
LQSAHRRAGGRWRWIDRSPGSAGRRDREEPTRRCDPGSPFGTKSADDAGSQRPRRRPDLRCAGVG